MALSLAIGALLGAPGVAFADSSERGDRANGSTENKTGAAACGDVEIRTDMRCEVVTSGSCTARCSEGTRFTAACNGRCAGRCSQSATAECRAECATTCESSCAGGIDCSGHCTGQCDADCEAQCQGDETCAARCDATCEAQCSMKCAAVPVDGQCADVCASSCDAVCTARANAGCEVDCDGSCRAELRGSCEVSCTDARAALFCDGQYLDATVDLDACVSHITAGFRIDVNTITEDTLGCKAEDCVNNVKRETREASSGCSTVSSHSTSRDAGGALVLSAVGALAALSVRRKARSAASDSGRRS